MPCACGKTPGRAYNRSNDEVTLVSKYTGKSFTLYGKPKTKETEKKARKERREKERKEKERKERKEKRRREREARKSLK